MSRLTLVLGLGVSLALPVQAATQKRARPGLSKKPVVNAKRALAYILATAVASAPMATLASPGTFASEAQKQLHPITAQVASNIAAHLQTLKQNGWTVNYHGAQDLGIHALAGQAPDKAPGKTSLPVQRAVTELQRLTGVPLQKDLTHFAVHFTSAGKFSVNAANHEANPLKAMSAESYWRYMVPQKSGVYDLFGVTDAKTGVRTTSAWHAEATPWGIFATPAAPPADLSSFSP